MRVPLRGSDLDTLRHLIDVRPKNLQNLLDLCGAKKVGVKLELTGEVVGEDIGMHVQDGPSYYHPFVTAARCVMRCIRHEP